LADPESRGQLGSVEMGNYDRKEVSRSPGDFLSQNRGDAGIER